MEQLFITESRKNLVHTIIGIKTGWRHEKVGKRGITHFLEHAIFLGNDDYPSPDNEVAKYGVSLEGMAMPEHTIFFFTSSKDDFAKNFTLLLSLIYQPKFDEEKLNKEKEEKILTTINQESNFTPRELAHEWAKNILFNWDFMSSLGTEEELMSITKGDLEDWHRKYYHAQNSFIVIYGDVRKDEVIKLIERAEVPLNGEIPEPTKINWDKKESFTKSEGMRNAEMVYGFGIPEYNIEWEILSVILGNYPISKLWKDRFSKFTYTVGSQLKWTSTGGGFFLYFGANSIGDTYEIDKNLWSLFEDLEIDEDEFAKKIKLIEIWRMKESGEQGLLRFISLNPFLRYKNFDEMAEKINQTDKKKILALSKRLLNKENVVKIIVAGER